MNKTMSHLSAPGGYRRQKITMTTHTGVSKPGSERDSGFSDASSGYLSAVDLTDSEETRRSVSAIGQHQMTMVGSSYPGLSPMIIMNNFVLKQPTSISPAEHQWSFPSSMEVMPPSQVVLLQPMVSNGNVGPVKTTPENKIRSKNYLPILKSYPRIAPHPGECPTKRQGSSTGRTSPVTGCEQRQRRHHHRYSSPVPAPRRRPRIKTISQLDTPNQGADGTSQPKEHPLSLLTDDSSVASSQDDLASSQDDLAPLPVLGVRQDGSHDAPSEDGDKLKRFSNTYNILDKSGLLGITLRTKRLIRENRCTQGQLQLLQEQTALLTEALRTGDPQLWNRLQGALRDEASALSEDEVQLGRNRGISV